MNAETTMSFVPVPANTGVGGYWLKDPERTTPAPQPVYAMLGINWLAKKTIESIPGLLVSVNNTKWRVAKTNSESEIERK